jgi:hypothetical protein
MHRVLLNLHPTKFSTMNPNTELKVRKIKVNMGTVIPRVHILTELKPSLTAKQNVCELYFSIMQSKNVPVPKIQSCFIICHSACKPQLS